MGANGIEQTTTDRSKIELEQRKVEKLQQQIKVENPCIVSVLVR